MAYVAGDELEEADHRSAASRMRTTSARLLFSRGGPSKHAADASSFSMSFLGTMTQSGVSSGSRRIGLFKPRLVFMLPD